LGKRGSTEYYYSTTYKSPSWLNSAASLLVGSPLTKRHDGGADSHFSNPLLLSPDPIQRPARGDSGGVLDLFVLVLAAWTQVPGTAEELKMNCGFPPDPNGTLGWAGHWRGRGSVGKKKDKSSKNDGPETTGPGRCNGDTRPRGTSAFFVLSFSYQRLVGCG
jgi:hypothetical protein